MEASGFRNHVGSFLWLSLGFISKQACQEAVISVTCPAHKKLSAVQDPFFLTGLFVRGLYKLYGLVCYVNRKNL
jgi:hypothetical protein